MLVVHGAAAVVPIVVVAVFGLIGSVQSLVLGSRPPCNTVLALYMTVQYWWSNVTLHPASQNCRVASSEAWERPGTMWAVVMASGSHGISRLQVWLEDMMLPSGRVTLMGFFAICLLVTGAPATRKCPVAPESDMPIAGSLLACALYVMCVGVGWVLWWNFVELSAATVLSSESIL